jgi:hypothetical protein
MFERIVEQWTASLRSAAELGAIALTAVASASIALAFLCAAAFVFVFDRYGLISACVAGAVIFLLATRMLLFFYASVSAKRMCRVNEAKARAAVEAESRLSPVTDPRIVLTALQIVQAIGIRRMLPILALGVVFSLSVTRRE